jgi:hypothetical protein
MYFGALQQVYSATRTGTLLANKKYLSGFISPNIKVSDRSQPPLMVDLCLSESAGSDSLHRLVGQDW